MVDADAVLSLLEAINAALKGPRPARKLVGFIMRTLGAVMVGLGTASPIAQRFLESMPVIGR